jgi:hypothetical protein
VAVGEGNRPRAVLYQYELPPIAILGGDAGHDAWCLVGQPDRASCLAELPDEAREPGALRNADIGQDGGVVNDQGRVPRGPAREGGGIRYQVALVHLWRVTAGSLDGRGETFPAVVFSRPQQALEPPDVVIVGHVERVQVKTGPPGNLGNPCREGNRATRLAGQLGCLLVHAGYPITAVVVGVPVHEQGESRARADLNERQRPGEQRQGGQQGRAPGGLVGLRAPGAHGRGQFAASIANQLSQRGEIGRSAQQVAGGRE